MYTNQGFGSLWTSIRDAGRTLITAPIAAVQSIEQSIGIRNPATSAVISLIAPPTAQPQQIAVAPLAPSAAPFPPAQSIPAPAPAPITVAAPAPVYYRNNPDGSTSVIPSPELSGMIEIDPPSALTATYVPPPNLNAPDTPKSNITPILIGAALIAMFGS